MTLKEIKELNDRFKKNEEDMSKFYGNELLSKDGKHIGVDLMLNDEGLELQVCRVIKTEYDKNMNIIKYWETFAFEDINIDEINSDDELKNYLQERLEYYENQVKNDIDEEGFVINRNGANHINGMIYRGIYVQYLYDTNTLIFTIDNEDKSFDDSDDLDCIVYRNYSQFDIEKHIDTLIKNLIDEGKVGKVYHLKNTYNDHDEYTTDENKIIMILIDEMAQCCENNLTLNNFGKYEYENASGWLNQIMTLCGKYNRNEIDIDEVIKQLNKEHFWSIEMEIRRKGSDIDDK